MTKGKYAARSAEKRAEAAEMTTDRMAEEMLRWKKEAHRYKSEAERANALARELRKLREVVGMPVADHLAELDAIKAGYEARLDDEHEAMIWLFRWLAKFAEKAFGDDEEFISAILCTNLQRVPRAAALELLKALGVDSETRKALLEPGMRNLIAKNADTKREVLQTFMHARQIGALDEDGRLPGRFVISMSSYDPPADEPDEGSPRL